jgi:MGT family glycosyltransferase
MAPRLPSGLAFQPFAERDQPLGSLEPYLDRLSRLGGPVSMWRFIHDLARFTDVICRELPGALDRVAPDALIIDQTDAAASLVATALGVPFVNIANALPLNLEPALPPPVLPWPYDPSPKGLRRNQGGYRVARFVERPITKVIRRHAERLGRPEIRFADETWSKRAQITQCVQGLDFPRAQLPDSFHYVGPFRETDAPLDLDLPDDGRPVIFCSFGSLQGSRAGLFRAVAAAAAELDLILVIAHGGLLPAAEIARLSGRPVVRAYVPQRALLARCALAITHAGFNTVMDALSSGVPMVALPITFEQPATGARLERAGVAVVLQRRRTEARIRDAIQEVLSNPSYRESAGRLRTEIGGAGGVRRAADLIEQVV